MGGKPKRWGAITHEYEAGGGVYLVTAPSGYCLGPELHQLVHEYYSDVPGERRAAREAAIKARKEYPLRPCTIDKCEWCNND